MSQFGNAIAQALGSIAAIAGETVSYHRGAASVAGLTAVPAATELAAAAVDGVGVGFVAKDWILQASELAIGGQAILPQRGDQVRRGERVYEVLPDDGRGGKPYRYCDTGQTRIRVHTKEAPAA